MRPLGIGTTRNRAAIAALFALLLVSLLLFGQATTVSADVTVNIQDFAFVPGTMTVPVGTKVVWTNQDDAVHTTTSDASIPVWDSSTLRKGQSFSFTFTQAGTFAYHCNFHPFMTGTITVTTSAASPPSVVPPTGGSGDFANSAFRAQWQQGEALAPNFWGPIATAQIKTEPYAETQGGMRVVQYFDKGRMELTNPSSGAVTNGLLANELITGKLQRGDSTFESRAPANIPIAGDADNPGPTYAALGTTAAALLAMTPAQTGMNVTTTVAANGMVAPGAATPGSGPTALSLYDSVTQHNVPSAFAAYRDRVGLLTIGYAKSEPFLATVKVGGVSKQVMVQVFERRVLTYTADNPDPFKVEMGNIGQHYLRWRY